MGDKDKNVISDVESERRQRVNEARYRRLFEAAREGILILDADTGPFVDANPFLTELTGHSREDLLDKALWEIGPLFVSNVYLVGDRRVIQCNVRDISARERADAERQLLTTAIEQPVDTVIITDAHGSML